MSGGSMDYAYSRLEMEIPSKERIEEYFHEDTPEETKELAYACIKALEEAVIIAKRLEWWMSGDDGDVSFIRRTKEELKYDLTKNKTNG